MGLYYTAGARQLHEHRAQRSEAKFYCIEQMMHLCAVMRLQIQYVLLGDSLLCCLGNSSRQLAGACSVRLQFGFAVDFAQVGHLNNAKQ